jgi:hypothetical protein
MKLAFKKNAWLILTVALWSVFQAVQLDNEWDRMDGDDAQYILHARSLLVHHRYNDPNLIYRPGAITTAESVPPGWPVLLLPVVALFGVRLIALKAYVIVFALLSGLLLHRILMRLTRDALISLLITGKYYFSMTTIVFSRVIYSEWPFYLTMLAAVWIVLRQDGKKERNALSWAAAGLAAGLALSCRSAGIALVAAAGAVLAGQVLKRRPIRHILLRFGAFAAGVLFVFGSMQILVKAEKAPGYKSQIMLKNIDFHEQGQATPGEILARIPVNAKSFVKSQWPQVFGRTWHEYAQYKYPAFNGIIWALIWIFGAVFTVLTVLGFLDACKKGPTIVEYTTLFYLAIMMIIWFSYEPYRYLMPVGPFLFYYLTRGLLLVPEALKRPPAAWRRRIVVFLLVVLGVNVFHAGIEVYKYKFSERNAFSLFRPYKATVAWLKAYVMPGEILVADEPRWYALETGLRVTTFLKSRDPEKVLDDLSRLNGAVIVFDPSRHFQKLCLVPVFEKYGDRFRLIQEFGHIRIYELKKSKDGD